MNKTATRPSLPALFGFWLLAILSLGLMAGSGAALMGDLGSFRSCNANSSGLLVKSCGKQGLNGGDLLLIVIFLGCVAIAISLLTHAWRLSRRPS